MGRPVVLKDSIYQAALFLFGERGLAETSIRDIARKAGVSEGSMYRHWPSKIALAWDIFKTHLEKLAGEIRGRMQQAATPYQQVHATITAFYQLFDQNRNLFRFILLNQHELWPRLGETSDNPVKLWERFVFGRWSTHPHPELSPAIAMSITLGMILQPAVSGLYGTVEVPLIQHVDAVTRQICKVLEIEIPRS